MPTSLGLKIFGSLELSKYIVAGEIVNVRCSRYLEIVVFLFIYRLCSCCTYLLFVFFGFVLLVFSFSGAPVVQSPIATNPGLTLIKTHKADY